MKNIISFLIALLVIPSLYAIDDTYVSHSLSGSQLVITTAKGELRLTPQTEEAVEVVYQPHGMKQLPSFAIAGSPVQVDSSVDEVMGKLYFDAGQLRAVISKNTLAIRWYRNRTLLVDEETGAFAYDTLRGFRFRLEVDEIIMGGGQRIANQMNRRGNRYPLYNQADYNYNSSDGDQNKGSQMAYFGIPAIFSSNKYILLFDNSARGALDIGKTESDILQFEAVAGRLAYVIVAGETYSDVVQNFTEVTGRQPMPPRWAFGNYSSRFGYHSEQQTRDTIAKFIEDDIPVDNVILDIYWFGPEIKGTMGNLEWYRENWPTGEKMIADFADQGINTIMVTEPFILTTSKKWPDALANNAVAKSIGGGAKTWDFYFGNTGLVDVFSESGQSWFWSIYKGMLDMGVAGHWGDLGEPEVHPYDTIHAVGTADEIHNAYGHKWAELIYNNQIKAFPDKRVMSLMRAGFAGSQRYGMVNWTGDVGRYWHGLQPQVEMTTQMGLLGMAYTHSDLGGFAAGDKLDTELYLRWLNYGVFQPLFRPHAQDVLTTEGGLDIPPEPVFHDDNTKAIARDFIKLRYRLLPYLYTMAWQNSATGMPLTRPLFLMDDSAELMHENYAYMWGDSLLVRPVVEPGITEQTVSLPAGKWFSFWDDTAYEGGEIVTVPAPIHQIPVLVKAGAFIPMVNDMPNTRAYNSEQLTVHYYADKSVKKATGMMYDDDGKTRDAYQRNEYELLNFSANQSRKQLEFTFQRYANVYTNMPASRSVTLVIHNWPNKPEQISVNNQAISAENVSFDPDKRLVTLQFAWDKDDVEIVIKD